MRVKRPETPATDGFIRGFGCCASVTILVIGAIMLGIMIGFGLKDAKLLKSAAALEEPIRASDFQNVFVKRADIFNASAPLKLRRANATRNRSPFHSALPTRNNVTAKVEKNFGKAKATYNFERAKTLAAKIRGDIHEYWQIDDFPAFKKTMHIPKAEWETYKRKFEHLLTHPNSTKTFTIAFGGSSVTAGHDNFLNEAYPALVQRQLMPLFSLLGVRLQVLNVGIGNNPCYPYDLCMEAHIPGNTDLISWEQSLNCGRNPEPVEAFIRTSAQSNKRPMILIMASGTPYWEPQDCEGVSAKAAPLTAEEIKDARLPLDVLANKSTMLWDFTFLQPEGAGLDKNLAHYYRNVAPITGQSLNGVMAYKCKGPYGPDFGVKTLGKGKLWHPGVKGHKLRADSFSYFMTSILSNALTDIVSNQVRSQRKKDARSHAAQDHFNTHTWDPKSNPLPMPLLCDRAVCRQAVKPTCKTLTQPQFNPAGSLTKALIVPNVIPPGWTTELSWLDVAGVSKAQADNRNYLDKKIIFVSDSNTTQPLEFILNPKTRDSLVWLCQVSRGFAKYPPSMADLDTGAVVTVEPYDGKPGPSTAKVLSMKKVEGENECYASTDRIAGKTRLAIRKAKATVQINLAYMLYW